MFEQTLLTHPATTRKTGAIAASFVAQMTLLGVLLVGPLLYTQALPMLPALTVNVFVPPPPPPPPPEVKQVVTSIPANTRAPARTFVPTQVPTAPIRTASAAPAYEAPPELTVVSSVSGPVGIAGTTLPVFTSPEPRADFPKQSVSPPEPPAAPLRVSGGVLAAKLLRQVVPQYPTLARQTRVSGSVHLLGIIAKDGRVRDLHVIDGHPLLRQAALDAVSQWVYSPTILNGLAVEVEAPIEVNFALR